MNSIVEEFYSMEYGPAPEDTKEVDRWLDAHHRTFGHYINGAWTKPAAGEYFATSNPATGDKIADVAHADAADVDAAVKAARKALPGMAGAHRPPARPLSLRARAPGTEALAPPRSPRDHGQRQAHPREPRHRHSAGRAPLLSPRRMGAAAGIRVPRLRSLRSRRPDHSLEFPAADVRVEGCACARRRQHRRHQARRIHATHRAGLRGTRHGSRPAAGRAQRRHRRRPHRRAAGRASTTSTRSPSPARPKSAASSARQPPAPPRSSRSNSAANLPSSSSTTPTSTPPSKAWSMASGSTRDRSAAPARACWCRSASPKPSSPRSARAWRSCASARRWTRQSTWVPSSRPYSSSASASWSKGVAEGATCWQPAIHAAAEGPLLPANSADRRASDRHRGAGRDLWPGAGVHDLPHAQRSRRAREQHHLRARLDRLQREHQRRARRRLADQGRRLLGELHQHVRRVLRLRRLPRERLRPRRWPRRHVRIPGTELGCTTLKAEARRQAAAEDCPSDDRTKTLADSIDRTVKQYIGGKQARPDCGYSFPVYARDGKLIGEAPLGNRKDIRNAVEAARKAAKWAQDRSAQPRAGALLHCGEHDPAPRRARRQARTGRRRGPGRASKSKLASSASSPTPAGRTSSRASVHNPPMRNVTLAMNEAIGTIGIICPTEAPLLGLLSLVLPAIAMGNTVVAVPSEVRHRHRRPLSGLRHQRSARRRRQHRRWPRRQNWQDARRPRRHRRHLVLPRRGDATLVKLATIGNMKQTWTNDGYDIDWFDAKQAEGRYFLRHATQVKNIWVPYGE